VLAQRALIYLRDFMVIIACLLTGKALAALLPFAFPGSILGLLILFVLLSLQIVKLGWVEQGAGLLLRHMGVLFVPVAVGLVAWLAPLSQSIELILLCVVVGIVLILAVVGRLYQHMNRQMNQKIKQGVDS
jgi:holin-like protein